MLVPTQDPIVVAPSPTPFREDDSVDLAAIELNVAKWLETPLSGFVLNSENGEEAFLSEQERLEIVRTVNQVRGDRCIVGGVDSPSARETLRMGEALVAAGADLLRVRIPRLTASIRGYFKEVVPRAAAPIVIIHQMAPGMFLSGPTTAGAPAELIGELTALDNVFGYIASADLRFEAHVRHFVPREKRFWTANGACMMLGNVAPRECRDVLLLAAEGKLQEAQPIQARLIEPDWQILSRAAAGLKAALKLLGYDAGVPRAPNPPCDAAAVEQIRRAMNEAGLIG
jgi:dihydrodipicolinate synthase/N-acetylneuraminate lyase